MNDQEIINTTDLFIKTLVECAQKNNYADLGIKIYRNQPPKKLDIQLENKLYEGTRIKIRNIEIAEDMNVTFKSDVNIKFFGHDFNTCLTENQEKQLQYFVYEVSKFIIKMYFLNDVNKVSK